jgi:hypothetical protein
MKRNSPVFLRKNFTITTRVIIMITLTSDKFALVKAGFSIRDLIHQVPGRSTPRQIAHPRGFAPPER